jgi:hypothetical protein
MAVRFSAVHAGPPLPQRRFLVLISARGWVDPRAIVRLEWLGQMKIPVKTGNRIRDHPTSRKVPQGAIISRAPSTWEPFKENFNFGNSKKYRGFITGGCGKCSNTNMYLLATKVLYHKCCVDKFLISFKILVYGQLVFCPQIPYFKHSMAQSRMLSCLCSKLFSCGTAVLRQLDRCVLPLEESNSRFLSILWSSHNLAQIVFLFAIVPAKCDVVIMMIIVSINWDEQREQVKR